MTSGGDWYYAGTSKLIEEISRWNGSCVMRFLLESRSRQTMILHLCASGEYTTVMGFSIRRGNARFSAPSRSWSMEDFQE